MALEVPTPAGGVTRRPTTDRLYLLDPAWIPPCLREKDEKGMHHTPTMLHLVGGRVSPPGLVENTTETTTTTLDMIRSAQRPVEQPVRGITAVRHPAASSRRLFHSITPVGTGGAKTPAGLFD